MKFRNQKLKNFFGITLIFLALLLTGKWFFADHLPVFQSVDTEDIDQDETEKGQTRLGVFPGAIELKFEPNWGWHIGDLIPFELVVTHQSDVVIDRSLFPTKGQPVAKGHPCLVWSGPDGQRVENPVYVKSVEGASIRHTFSFKMQCFAPTPVSLRFPPLIIPWDYTDSSEKGFRGTLKVLFDKALFINMARLSPSRHAPLPWGPDFSPVRRSYIATMFLLLGLILLAMSAVGLTLNVRDKYRAMLLMRQMSPLRREILGHIERGSVPLLSIIEQCERLGIVVPDKDAVTALRIRNGRNVSDQDYRALMTSLSQELDRLENSNVA